MNKVKRERKAGVADKHKERKCENNKMIFSFIIHPLLQSSFPFALTEFSSETRNL